MDLLDEAHIFVPERGSGEGAMRSLGLIAYPAGGLVAATPLLFLALST